MEQIKKIGMLERRIAETDKGFPNDHNLGRFDAYKWVLSLIDTIEVKEVDFGKEYKDFINSDNGRSMFETAKHFFELGLKTQKGE